MKRVMVVDDEFLVRIGIKSMLNWEEKGYSIVAEAANGQDAIDKIARFEPQIILTDLMMEPVNGLELIKYCSSRHPAIRMVVLSNYNDFEKVKTAMKLGARDYLFKLTVKPEELIDILDGISQEIDQHRLSGNDAELMLNRNASAIRQRLIRMMIESSYSSETDLLRELQLVNVSCDFNQPYVVLYLTTANYTGEALEPELFAVSLENTVSELTQARFKSQTFRTETGQCLVVINGDVSKPQDRLPPDLIDRIGACFEQIDLNVRRYFGVRICGTLSCERTGIKAFASAAADCRRVMRHRFLLKENRLLLCAREKPPINELKMPPNTWISDWRLALEHGQYQEAAAFVERLCRHFYSLEGIETHLIREKLDELYWTLKADCASKGIALDSLANDYGLPLHQAVAQYDLLTSIEESFLTILRRVEAEAVKGRGRRLKKEIADIILFVNTNLAHELNVTEAARMAHMSESYFSHLFKNEMGIGFVNYVNRVRIEKAREMLVRTDLKIDEIALRVGIGNPNYFSILFKKSTGISPKEFRSTHITEYGYESNKNSGD
jgi:two-component system, response regulator YesN